MLNWFLYIWLIIVVRILQRNRTKPIGCMCMSICMYNKISGSHRDGEIPRSVSWQLRSISGIVPVQVKVLRSRRAYDVSSSMSPKAGGNRCPSSKIVRESEVFLTLPFVLFRTQWIEWGPPTLGRANALLSPLTQMLTSPGSTFTDTCAIMFNQRSGHLMAQSGSHIKLTITVILCKYRI